MGNKKGMWSLNFSTASLVLIPAAVGINYIGKFFAEALSFRCSWTISEPLSLALFAGRSSAESAEL
ncbi:hypothetical protein [Clostridium sp. AM58-1XD]|uniref:hypothetical protein n=1 Tax=Clostridium sp. AM58-1XD TaxID=2292307 RepID=UPI002687D3C7